MGNREAREQFWGRSLEYLDRKSFCRTARPIWRNPALGAQPIPEKGRSRRLNNRLECELPEPQDIFAGRAVPGADSGLRRRAVPVAECAGLSAAFEPRTVDVCFFVSCSFRAIRFSAPKTRCYNRLDAASICCLRGIPTF